MEENFVGIKYKGRKIYIFMGISAFFFAFIALLIFIVITMLDLELFFKVLSLINFFGFTYIGIMNLRMPNLYCLELYEKKFILRLLPFFPVVRMNYDKLKKLKVNKKIIRFITKKDKKIDIRRSRIKEEDIRRLIEFFGKHCEIEISQES